MDNTHITVFLSAYNEKDVLEKCLSSIKAQDYPPDRFEIIVVDDASTDGSLSTAEKYADRVIRNETNIGVSKSHRKAIDAAKGDILVSIDADVVLPPGILTRISRFFGETPEADAVTGLLSKDTPIKGLFTRYKNLYMHYIFSLLPEKVSFLYGSINAFRKDAGALYVVERDICQDSEFGQELTRRGKTIYFLKDLSVIHLKRFDFASFFKNDFIVPYAWGQIFMRHEGWRTLLKGKTGYLHSPKEQLLSIAIAPITTVIAVAGLLSARGPSIAVPFLLLIWFFLNSRFLFFLLREKGPGFGLIAILITFIDNIVMASGILSGIGSEVIKGSFIKHEEQSS